VKWWDGWEVVERTKGKVGTTVPKIQVSDPLLIDMLARQIAESASEFAVTLKPQICATHSLDERMANLVLAKAWGRLAAGSAADAVAYTQDERESFERQIDAAIEAAVYDCDWISAAAMHRRCSVLERLTRAAWYHFMPSESWTF
jgi:hypothetical protein